MAHILVIDDEAPIRGNLVRFLKLEGHRTTEAADGNAGLALALGADAPDLILCDVMMPGLTGFELLAALQVQPGWRRVPFLFLSASAETERLQQALQDGATAYITKPFNLQQLRDLLKALLP